MKKALSLLLLLLLCGLLLAGCTQEKLHEPQRIYAYRESEAEIMPPSLIFYEDSKFQFIFSPLSSYIGIGTYTEEDGQLVLKTDDGEFTYRFDIVGDTFVFDAEKSSDNTWFADIPDGAVFK